jgi:parvulin-like peptidyl-prolyl isomerase
LGEFNSTSLGIEVSDNDVENQIDKIISNQKITKERLLSELKREGKTYVQYKSMIKNHMLLSKFKSRVVWPNIKITKKDIQNYYKKRSGQSTDALELTLKQIRIDIPKGSPDFVRDKKIKTAQEIVKKTRVSKDFDAAANLVSSAFRPGDSDYILKTKFSDLNADIKKSLGSLELTSLSDPVILGDNIYIFQIIDKKSKKDANFVAQKQAIESEIREKQMLPILNKWLRTQRQQNKVRIIQDPSSSKNPKILK